MYGDPSDLPARPNDKNSTVVIHRIRKEIDDYLKLMPQWTVAQAFAEAGISEALSVQEVTAPSTELRLPTSEGLRTSLGYVHTLRHPQKPNHTPIRNPGEDS